MKTRPESEQKPFSLQTGESALGPWQSIAKGSSEQNSADLSESGVEVTQSFGEKSTAKKGVQPR